MNDEAKRLMLFYSSEERKEWERISGKSHDQIVSEDFAHCEFCAAVVRSILLGLLNKDIASNNSAKRYWAGTQLYKDWRISKKIEELASTAWN